MSISMAEQDASRTLRLINWVSPNFPIGSFGYSHGLEAAAVSGAVTTAEELQTWLASLIEYGSVSTDLTFCSLAYRAEPNELVGLCDLAISLAPGRERMEETLHQGKAFLDAQSAWDDVFIERSPPKQPYPIAFGYAGRRHMIGLNLLLVAFANSIMTNLAQAGIRLGILGQTQAWRTISKLEPLIVEVATKKMDATRADLGSATVLSDLMSLQHEQLDSRIFLS